jgi:ribosomal protein S18 acetylase RimI-like enzyme
VSRENPGGVRRATLQDIDRVAELWVVITEHHRDFDPIFAMRSDASTELANLLHALHRDPDAVIFVYQDGVDLPGMCIVHIDRSPPIMDESERAEITDLGVRSTYRRRGIGGALLDAALAWIEERGVSRVEVQVAKRNGVGQGFWRAKGFGDLMDVLHKRL